MYFFLLKYFLNIRNTYRLESANQDSEFVLACKRRVVQFVHKWTETNRQAVLDDQAAADFIEVSPGCIRWAGCCKELTNKEASLKKRRKKLGRTQVIWMDGLE